MAAVQYNIAIKKLRLTISVATGTEPKIKMTTARRYLYRKLPQIANTRRAENAATRVIVSAEQCETKFLTGNLKYRCQEKNNSSDYQPVASI